MEHSEHSAATERTVARIVSEALARGTREAPRFEPGCRVWVKVRAPESLRARRITETVWREAVVLLWMEDRRAYQVFLAEDPGLAFLASPGRVRRDPPWRARPPVNDV